jgi:hypothetical protein
MTRFCAGKGGIVRTKAAAPPAGFSLADLSPFAHWSIGYGTGNVRDTGGGTQTGVSFDSLGAPTTAWVITQVDDLSGNGHHVAQATEAQQPSLLQSNLNSRPVLLNVFATLTKLTKDTGFSLAQPMSVFALLYATNFNFRYFLGSDTSARINFGASNTNPGALRVGTNSSLVNSVATMTRDAWHKVIMMIDNAGGVTNLCRIDGTLGNWAAAPPTGTAPVAAFGGGVKLGSYYDGNRSFEGRIAELAVFGRVLSTTDQATIDSRVSTYYGI